MKWEFVTLYGEKSNTPTSFQIDSVGNIIQQKGGVKPIACQKCKKKFNPKRELKNLTQLVPLYGCEDCKFTSNSGEVAFEHVIENPTHRFVKKTKERIVGQNIIKTDRAVISKFEDEVHILCGDCSAIS
jgi:NAD-dependent SIR2 family protein deacetylase